MVGGSWTRKIVCSPLFIPLSCHHSFHPLSLSLSLSLSLWGKVSRWTHLQYLWIFNISLNVFAYICTVNCSIILWINYYYFSFFFGLYAILITKYFHRYYLGELKYSQVFLFYLYGTKKLIGVQVLLNYREKCIGRSHVFNGCPSFSWLYFSLIFLVSLFNCKYLQYYSLFYLLFLYEPEYKNSKLFYLLFL